VEGVDATGTGPGLESGPRLGGLYATVKEVGKGIFHVVGWGIRSVRAFGICSRHMYSVGSVTFFPRISG
jgi:hypothetical protein